MWRDSFELLRCLRLFCGRDLHTEACFRTARHFKKSLTVPHSLKRTSCEVFIVTDLPENRLNTLIDTSDPVTQTRSRNNTFAERLYWQPWKRDIIDVIEGQYGPFPMRCEKFGGAKWTPGSSCQQNKNNIRKIPHFIDCLLGSQVTQRATSSHRRAQKKCWCLSIAISNLKVINNVPRWATPGYSKTHF